MMAAWNVRPVSEFLFLFFTGRGDSFLSPKRGEKNGGANVLLLEKQKENAVNSPFLKENRKQARKRHSRTISIVPA